MTENFNKNKSTEIYYKDTDKPFVVLSFTDPTIVIDWNQLQKNTNCHVLI